MDHVVQDQKRMLQQNCIPLCPWNMEQSKIRSASYQLLTGLLLFCSLRSCFSSARHPSLPLASLPTPLIFVARTGGRTRGSCHRPELRRRHPDDQGSPAPHARGAGGREPEGRAQGCVRASAKCSWKFFRRFSPENWCCHSFSGARGRKRMGGYLLHFLVSGIWGPKQRGCC